MMKHFFYVALIFVFTLAMGCASTPAVSPDGNTPVFTLKLRSHSIDHRFTYFEVGKTGEVRFGGGRSAAVYEAAPDFTLTPEQRAAVWRLIVDQKIVETESFPFDDFKSIEYHVTVWPGSGLGRSFRSIDGHSPGVKALHDLLFKYHLDANVKLPGLNTGAVK